ncbi:malate dehydrogenase 1B, partial [Asbolus verrucosus]
AWLDKINSANHWYHTTSPIVWREINRRGGKAYLIGGLGEFWEYCYDYYGFQSRISKQDLSRMITDNLLIASESKEKKDVVISIIGASSMMMSLLIVELQDCIKLKPKEAVYLRLFDADLHDVDKADYLLEVVDEITPSLKWRPNCISLVSTIAEAVTDCDLLLVIEDFNRHPFETTNDWYRRCMTSMLFLAAEINTYAKRSLRVVLSHDGPLCFNASVLVENCTKIRLANIVAVTADEGMVTISKAAEHVDDLVENFWCPPVWGFSGTSSFVDVGRTVIKAEVCRPYRRTLTRKEGSRLPKGVILPELRVLGHLLKSDDAFYKRVETKKMGLKDISGQAHFAKIRATASLIRLWFAEENSDDIISLGVCSNGSFGFPPGVVFSQAVIQNEKRLWEPFTNFPVSRKATYRIHDISLEIGDLLKKYNLGEKMT